MKYAFIDAHKEEFPIQRMCAVLGISRQGYYAWRDREPSQRQRQDEELTQRIKAMHEQSYQTCGSPRIQAELREADLRVSRRRIRRLMGQAGLEVRYAKPKRPRTTHGHQR